MTGRVGWRRPSSAGSRGAQGSGREGGRIDLETSEMCQLPEVREYDKYFRGRNGDGRFVGSTLLPERAIVGGKYGYNIWEK